MTNNSGKDPDGARAKLLLALESDKAFGIERLPLCARPDRESSPIEEDSLEALRAKIEQCTLCPLHENRTNTVPGEGNPEADLMFVGEGPGQEEDLSGRPFVGAAGRLLTKMIEPMGFGRSEVYIANVIKCRPPGNRTPLPEEIAACSPYLERQIARIAPRVIVALGAPAARTLVSSTEGINALRGKVYPCALLESVQVVPTFHPAYLLRKETEKPKAWQDLKLAMRLLSRDRGS